MTTVNLTANEVAAVAAVTMKTMVDPSAPEFVVSGLSSLVKKLTEAFDA